MDSQQQIDQVEETAEDTNLDRYETADFRPPEPTVFVD